MHFYETTCVRDTPFESRRGPVVDSALDCVQQAIPADSLLEWKKLSKVISCDVVIVVKASEVTAPRGRGQGKQKSPDLKTVVKPAFNKHAVREPGTFRSPAAGKRDE